MADAIVAHALPNAGCSWEKWFTYPGAEKERVLDHVGRLLLDGHSADDLFALMSMPTNVLVHHWPRLMLSRLPFAERAS